LILEAAEQAAAQGITITVSAGDNGSAGCDNFDTQAVATQGFAVNALASTPYTIAVGGTDFDVLPNSFASYVNQATSGSPPYYGTALKYIPESPWNDSTTVNKGYSSDFAYKNSQEIGNIIAGSGGVSTVYAKPAFQTSLTPQDRFRDVPDVSFLAGNGLYGAAWVICSDNVTDGTAAQTYTDCLASGGQFTSSTVFGAAGGTSASAPAFAAMLALVAQAHGSPSDNYRLGQADNILYQLARSQYSKVFHDVTTGNNSVPCSVGSPNCGSNFFLQGFNAGNGYDLASGLGSIDAAAMVNNWTTVSPASTSTTLKINGSTADYTGVHGTSLRFDVNVNPSAATGVVGIIDNANEATTTGGILNDGQFAIPISAGAGSATYNGLPGGSYTAWARYGGDTGNASSNSTPAINVTIAPEPSTTTLTVQAFDGQTGKPISTANIPYGSLVFADAQITGTAEGSGTQGVATGTVTFADVSGALGTTFVGSNDLASWPPLTSNVSVLPGGAHSVTASYSGDPSYNASASQPVSFTVVPLSTSMFVEDVPSTLTGGQSTTVAVTVATLWNPGATPTGTVTLSSNSTTLATISTFSQSGGYNGAVRYVDLIGVASVNSSQLLPGLNTITVAYSGDSNYASSSTTIQVDNVVGGGGVAFTTPDSISMGVGATATYTVTLTPSGGYSGFITWGCYSSPSNSALSCWIPETHVPLSGPVDTVLVLTANSAAAPGTYTLNINGSDNSSPRIQVTKTVTVTLSATASPSLTVMNSGVFNVAQGSSTGNTSFVSVIPSGGLTGQVNLSCAVTTLLSNPESAPTCSVPASVTLNGAVPVVADVQVNTTSTTTAGSYSVAVTATSASTSTITATDTVPLTVTASPSFALTSAGTVSVAPGGTTGNATTITVTPLNGFTGPVDLFCFADATFYSGTILPQCSVPSSINLSGGSSATVNVGVTSDPNSTPGFYIISVSAVDPNSTSLGIDTSLDLMLEPIAVPSFALGSGGNIQVSPGATSNNSSKITLTPSGGFTGGVNLTCSVATALANPVDIPSCSLAPSVLNVNGVAANSTVLTVSTTAPTTGALVPGLRPSRFSGLAAAFAVVILIGIRGKRRVWTRILGVLVLAVWIGALGCGGGGGSGPGGGGGGGGGTSAGTYSVTVTGTDAGTGKITATTTVTVTVN